MPEKAFKITINQDQKCSKCDKGGAIESSGICFSCSAKILTAKFKKEGAMSGVITEPIINLASDKIAKHLLDYHPQIDKAYNDLDEDEAGFKIEALTVNLKVKFQQAGKKIAMQTEIAFSTGKVKDGDKVLIDPNQPKLGEKY